MAASVAALAICVLPTIARPGLAQPAAEPANAASDTITDTPVVAQAAGASSAATPRVLFPQIGDQLKGTPAFFRDSKMDVNVRSFYFQRDPVNDRNSEAWALGGSVGLQSGWIEDMFSVGATYYTSQKLYGPEGRDGTLILAPGQEGYSVLGQAYGKLKLFDDDIITAGRSLYDTPFIGPNDVRMTPNTFQGYTISGNIGFSGNTKFKYDAGYVDRVKERNSSKFKYMSKSAGADTEEGVVMAGGTLSVDRFSVTGYEYYSSDVINIGYAEGKYSLPLSGDSAGLLAAQYIDQRSVGNDKLTGRDFDTGQVGVKGELGYAGFVFTLAYTQARDDATLRNPWSGYPGYTSVQVQDFNRPGEKALLGKVAYDLSRVGLQGLSTYALVVYGKTDATTAGPAEIDETEVDFDVQWRVPWEALRGLAIRGRYAYVDIDQTTSRGTIHDARIILNYNFLAF